MNTIWIAVAAVSLLGPASGATPGYVLRRFMVEGDPVVEKTDEILLQSQCGQCGYPGCRPHAGVISCNGEKTDCCAPGGEAAVLKIAELSNVEPQPLGDEAQEIAPARVMTATDGNNCTGCAKCVQACPVDTTAGATHAMHMVVSDLCTGYSLCVDPCSTHCISLQPVAGTSDSWKWDMNTIPVRITPMEHHA